MKRFFTFLMAVWALLSISQTVKADDVTVYFQCPDGWTTPVHAYAYGGEGENPNWANAPAGSEFYTSTGVKLWKCTFDSKYQYVIFKEDTGTNQYPEQNGQGFEVSDNYVYTSTGKTGTSLSDFVTKAPYTYTLRGGYGDGAWNNESSNFEYDGDGKYTYTFTATQTGDFRFRVNTSYTSGAALCPNVDGTTKRKKLTSTSEDVAYNDQKDASGKSMSDNYWFCDVTNGKKYTFTLTEQYNSTNKSYTRKLSVVPEGAVVTKVIKLFNGSSELTGTNGKYTLDLSSATADATITLSIDGASYGLATAQTISAAGTTSGIAFTTEGTKALKLKAGLIYSLSVTEDGKMTVVAKEKGVADGNYYLVGNFFDGETEINYDKKYFRFINSKGDGTLTFDIPASLEIKAQVYASDGTCYGPVDGGTGYGISNTHPKAAGKSVNGDLVAGTNYWTFSPRGLAQTGIYTITITVDPAGTPTKWEVKYDNSKRMAYFLVDPTKDPDAVVHPTYAVVNADRSCSNNFYGNIHLDASDYCFVVGNLKQECDNDIVGHPLKTTQKLYLQGNGGLDPTTDVDGSEKDNYTKLYPSKKPGFTYNETKTMVLEYNPSKGHNTVANKPENHGIGGEILKYSSQITPDPITSVQIVGNGVVGSWKLEDAKNMTYNKKLDCWEYTFTTDKSESAGNKFRFIANGSWEYNWGENSTEPGEQARIPYKDKTKAGHEASLQDPNLLGFTTEGTADKRDGAGTHGDMIFNRPAGKWTIRLYTRTLEKEDGSGYDAKHAYTITGSESKEIDLTYRKDKFIRTYSNDKPMNPDNDNVKIYEVYKYVKPEGGNADNIYARGTVYLRRLKYVPANVGVVLIGEAPAGGPYTDGQKVSFSLLERTEKSVEPGGDYREVWTKSNDYIAANDQWNNYLVPTVTAVNYLGNAKVDESGKITYRYFGLGNYYSTNYHKSLRDKDTQEDYIGFFRFTANGKSGANKAYLSIPANAEVGNRVGATYGFIDYNGQLLGNEDGENESIMPAQFAKMALVFDDLVDGNETTGIKELETKKMNNNKYYNLQGIEIAHPVKGIYIHNGKKIIVK